MATFRFSSIYFCYHVIQIFFLFRALSLPPNSITVHLNNQEWIHRTCGTQVLGPRAIIPKPEMQLTRNLHSGQPLWSSNWQQSFNLIGRSKLKIIKKPDFSPKLGLMFSLDLRHEGAEIAKNRWTTGERGALELSGYWNKFRFASLVTEIWAIEKG